MRQSNQSEQTIKIDCEVDFQNDKIIVVWIMKPGQKKPVKERFPLSQVTLHSKGLDDQLEIPEWLALDRGVI